MKRILILSNSDMGLYVFRKELIEELLKLYKVTLCMPYGTRVKDLVAMGCSYIEASVDRQGVSPIRDFRLLLKYLAVIKKVEPDITLTYTIKPNVYGGLACTLRRVPYITNITGLGAAFEHKGLLRSVVTLLYRVGMIGCTCVFFQNRDGQVKLLPYLQRNLRNKLIPGSGVNLKHFEFSKYPNSEDKVVFNYVGRIMRIKGIEDFLYCANEVKANNDCVHFNVIGSFDELQYKTIVGDYASKGIVQYLGPVNDVRPFISQCNAIIHASYSEGMSNVLLEHCAMGRPCIAPDIPGCREIVENGITGFLFDAGDRHDMLRAIESFISLNNEQKAIMGRKAREKVEREFDRMIIVKEYLDAIAEGYLGSE